MRREEELLLGLVRAALGHGTEVAVPEGVSWDALLRLADAQGVAAIAADGLQRASVTLPAAVRMQLASRVLLHERVYRRHEQLMVKLARTYRKGGFRMMVLKGWGLSLNYPVPEHRPSGDLDIWNFGQWREADAYVAGKGVTIDNSHHHHSVFYVEDLMVENHYDFINVHARRSNARLERIFKSLGEESHINDNVNNGKRIPWVEVYGERVYLPSANLHGLFLIRHAVAHFSAAEITLRQVLDWAFFVEKHSSEVDWDWLMKMLEEFGLKRFFDVLAERAIRQAMEKYRKTIGFEDSLKDYSLVFDLNKFELYFAKGKGDFAEKKYLRSIGSGANWLNAHLCLYLALADFFYDQKKSTVPSLLFLDQPSQVYFPAQKDRDEAFNPEEQSVHEADGDMKAVNNIFSLLYRFCMEHNDGIQVIVTDHADDLTIEGLHSFEDIVRARWRKDGEGLVDLRTKESDNIEIKE